MFNDREPLAVISFHDLSAADRATLGEVFEYFCAAARQDTQAELLPVEVAALGRFLATLDDGEYRNAGARSRTEGD
jgi:hypothetical protein